MEIFFLEVKPKNLLGLILCKANTAEKNVLLVSHDYVT